MIERFTDPDSSTIAGATYDPEQQTLIITFKRSTTFAFYQYRSVTPGLWARFKDATSHGSFFNSEIRPLYDGERITSPPKWAV